MRGQSNHCLRVCNVKMKKNYGGRNAPYLREFFLMGCHTPPCLGWEVNAHMSGQSNDGLRVLLCVRNVMLYCEFKSQKARMVSAPTGPILIFILPYAHHLHCLLCVICVLCILDQ